MITLKNLVLLLLVLSVAACSKDDNDKDKSGNLPVGEYFIKMGSNAAVNLDHVRTTSCDFVLKQGQGCFPSYGVVVNDSNYTVRLDYYEIVTNDTTIQIDRMEDFCQDGILLPAVSLLISHQPTTHSYESISGSITFDFGADTNKISFNNVVFEDGWDSTNTVTISGKFFCK